jgi:phospholipid transport system substrate-binding protein
MNHRSPATRLSLTLATALVCRVAAAEPAPAKAPPSPRPWIEQQVEAGRALAERRVTPGSKEEEAWRRESKALIDEVLDWQELTQQSLGTQWKKLSAAEQKEFAALLREMIEASYQSKLRLAARGDAKKPERVQLDWSPEKLDGDRASISAKVKADKKTAHLGFELRHDGARWRVYDVAIDEVSTVKTYRSQFRKLLDQKGYAGLVERIKAKIADIRAGRAEIAGGP